jgi:hypothetical protein
MEGIILSLGLSIHAGMQGDYNGLHPHVRFLEDGAIAGAYYNSMDRVSVYAGHRVESGAAGLEFALVTGYDELDMPVAPYVRGTYDLGKVRAYASPTMEKYNDDVNLGVVFGIELFLN